MIVVTWVAAIAARIAHGSWSWLDLVAGAGVVGLQPFTEWILHAYVLHARPRRVSRWEIDLLLARKHRLHHRDPGDLALLFVPMPVLVGGLAMSAAAALLVPGRSLALTALAAGVSMLLAYEWSHFLMHTSYRPRSRHFSAACRAHRLHHYRNERYWFGVTMHLGDRLLGTFPDRNGVPISATARSLGVDELEGARP
ncbi:MAG: sterol desaturase family protein [Acidimicrobiales bacterium]